MIDLFHRVIESVTLLECLRYAFMKRALLAVMLGTPMFALLGTMVVSNRMVFFSDVLGHSALTGVAIGVIMGLMDPMWSTLAFAVILAIGVNVFRRTTHAANETVLGVFLATTVALGIVILSRGGGFAKFSSYLIGDILAVSPGQLVIMAVLFVVVLAYWAVAANGLVLVSISPSLARSRGMSSFLIETSFAVLLAVVVTFSIRLVGILMINSLLVLPAAAARNLATNVRSYTLWTVALSMFSGFAGLFASYYWGTASGATIVLFSAAFYVLAAVCGGWWRGRAFARS